MNFFEITEKWASIHPEIQHQIGRDSKNKRFFLTKGFADMADFLQSQTSKTSPCLVMESSAPLNGNSNGWEHRDYTIYLCVRSPQAMQTMDGPEAMACKEKAIQLARAFRNSAVELNRIQQELCIERDYQIETFGPFWNYWYAAQLTLTVAEPYDQCDGRDLAYSLLEKL